MATETERPPSRIGKKVNPAYTAWRRAQKGEKARIDAVLSQITCTIGPSERIDFTKPEILTLRAISGARNTNFVRCALGNGDAVHARVRKGAAAKLIGKSIRVSVTEEDGEKKYTHLP